MAPESHPAIARALEGERDLTVAIKALIQLARPRAIQFNFGTYAYPRRGRP